jgi:hypothetical protein
VRNMGAICEDVLSANGLTGADIGYFIPHQANWRSWRPWPKKIGLPVERCSAPRWSATATPRPPRWASAGRILRDRKDQGRGQGASVGLRRRVHLGLGPARILTAAGRPGARPAGGDNLFAVRRPFTVGKNAFGRRRRPGAAVRTTPADRGPRAIQKTGQTMSEKSKAALVTGRVPGASERPWPDWPRGRLPRGHRDLCEQAGKGPGRCDEIAASGGRATAGGPGRGRHGRRVRAFFAEHIKDKVDLARPGQQRRVTRDGFLVRMRDEISSPWSG